MQQKLIICILIELKMSKKIKNLFGGIVGVTLVAVVVLLYACNERRVPEKGENVVTSEFYVDGTSNEEEGEALRDGKCLNDIRFQGYERKNWLDNEYIRVLRNYLDAFSMGRIDNEELQKYKDVVKGKFVIFMSEPFIAGGLFVQITFVDHPTHLFNAWVYSDVDRDTEKIVGYQVRRITKDEEPLDLTKEGILEIVSKDPDLKLW